ncbi:MAG: DUF1573 domain-containing protein [Bacteroidia bacterium]|nr:DUF1573 domain-containing protein [Bacteroidia bacterium]
MRILLLSLVVLLCARRVFAQAPSPKGSILFEKIAHEFGEIKEEGGIVFTVFRFENVGEGDLQLTSVKASCGCTTPTWSRDVVPSKGKGFIKVEFDPLNRPGYFSKTIQVETNSDPQPKVLTISGTVLPRQKGPADFYPFEEGNIRFKTNHLAFGHVFMGEKDTSSTVLYNQGNRSIHIFPEKTALLPQLKMQASSTVLKPGGTVRLSFEYSTYIKNDYGFLFEYFFLETDDEEKPKKRINVSADIQEDFRFMAADQKARAPKGKWDKTEHNFGTINQGDKAETVFTLTNTGQKDLLIRKTKASCGCTSSKPESTLLAPGTSTKVEVSFNSTGRAGLQEKTVTVITNDPVNPVIYLKIKCVVKGDGTE